MLKILNKFRKKKVITKPLIYNLPLELVSEILSFIEINEFMVVACTSKVFHKSMTTHSFWSQIYKKMGISQISPSEKPYHIPLLKFLKNSWDPQYTSPFLSVFDNASCVTRQISDCHNPAILAKNPLVSGSHVTFQIISCGKWLSLGLATRKFKLDDDSVVGTQKTKCVGIYYQDTTTKMVGSLRKKGILLKRLTYTKFVDSDRIQISRKETRICFSYNDELVCIIEDVAKDKVFWPCASLSCNSIVKLI